MWIPGALGESPKPLPAVHCGEFVLSLARPRIMGILNVTPDSFSDGGAHFDALAAITYGQTLVAQGADLIDVGGESTRPGAPEVELAEELRRVIPVIEGLVDTLKMPVSIDTRRPQVMQAAIRAGATLINDIEALQAPGALECILEHEVGICLMHMQGQPLTMQQSPHYPQGVVSGVCDFLAERVALLERYGVERTRILIDPGFGFGKTRIHNLTLLQQLPVLVDLGYPVLVGLSRKSMLVGHPGIPPRERLGASLAAACWAIQAGAHILRVHDVAATRQAVDLWMDTLTVEE
ncbi:dihydropteroate synthase [Ferrovum sp.]|uniref:dihydropteroate synthase n=2 Tax=Ferrovum sp. TaxID=2609467 RepID=UPI0026310D75|nr:dihydropteroate synthase [Ferrovum sp.]